MQKKPPKPPTRIVPIIHVGHIISSFRAKPERLDLSEYEFDGNERIDEDILNKLFNTETGVRGIIRKKKIESIVVVFPQNMNSRLLEGFRLKLFSGTGQSHQINVVKFPGTNVQLPINGDTTEPFKEIIKCLGIIEEDKQDALAKLAEINVAVRKNDEIYQEQQRYIRKGRERLEKPPDERGNLAGLNTLAHTVIEMLKKMPEEIEQATGQADTTSDRASDRDLNLTFELMGYIEENLRVIQEDKSMLEKKLEECNARTENGGPLNKALQKILDPFLREKEEAQNKAEAKRIADVKRAKEALPEHARRASVPDPHKKPQHQQEQQKRHSVLDIITTAWQTMRSEEEESSVLRTRTKSLKQKPKEHEPNETLAQAARGKKTFEPLIAAQNRRKEQDLLRAEKEARRAAEQQRLKEKLRKEKDLKRKANAPQQLEPGTFHPSVPLKKPEDDNEGPGL